MKQFVMAYTVKQFSTVDVDALHQGERRRCDSCGREIDRNGEPLPPARIVIDPKQGGGGR